MDEEKYLLRIEELERENKSLERRFEEFKYSIAKLADKKTRKYNKDGDFYQYTLKINAGWVDSILFNREYIKEEK